MTRTVTSTTLVAFTLCVRGTPCNTHMLLLHTNERDCLTILSLTPGVVGAVPPDFSGSVTGFSSVVGHDGAGVAREGQNCVSSQILANACPPTTTIFATTVWCISSQQECNNTGIRHVTMRAHIKLQVSALFHARAAAARVELMLVPGGREETRAWVAAAAPSCCYQRTCKPSSIRTSPTTLQSK
jgi:hypothetical protein